MGRYILALHAGHNSAACIGDEKGLAFAIQEERLNREKNYWGFPVRSLQACLDHVGAKTSDVACIAYGGHQVLSRYHSRDDVLRAYHRQFTLSGKLRQRVAMPLMLAASPRLGQSTLQRDLDEAGYRGIPVVHYGHHHTHAATAYYGLRKNPDEKYLVLTCDGAGDQHCASVRVMGGGEDRVVAETQWDNSLGAIYSWVTFAMGFVPLEHEYKLMGMAPYASERATAEAAQMFRSYLELDESGLRFKKRTRERTNDIAERLVSDMQLKRFDWLCAGLQRFTEDLLTEWTRNAVRATGIRKVLAAGGVFMNVKANKKIAELAEVDYFEAFPSCGDETLPMGAMWLEAAKRWGAAEVKPMRDFYLGADLDAAETDASVQRSGYPYTRPDDMPRAVAEVLAAGKPVARCAGQMEFGARALGNRSILADPMNQDVVRIINQMVKKRDFWMPFAPIMKESRHRDYVENPKNLQSPYMMMTFDTKENYRELIAAVHNADLTCRAQILRQGQNPEMYSIIDAFEARTGRAVLLNTSFNLHGFPIVRTASDALDVFRNSGLTHLQVGPYLVTKS